MAQELADHFTADMETVLRELGISDLKIPQKVRGLTASGAALLRDYEEALSRGEEAFTATIGRTLPLEGTSADDAASRLSAYLKEMLRHLEAEPIDDLCTGTLSLPPASVDQEGTTI